MMYCYCILRGVVVLSVGVLWMFSTSPLWLLLGIWEGIKEMGGLPISEIEDSPALRLPFWGFETLDRILP